LYDLANVVGVAGFEENAESLKTSIPRRDGDERSFVESIGFSSFAFS
jgi:hypothetical protein